MTSTPLDQILKFADLLHQFKTIERHVLIKNSDRNENDSEHSFSVAMLAWYINSTYNLDLDSDKLFKYSLAHDLVEIFAGDTYLYSEDKNLLNSKDQREDNAAERIKKDHPEFTELFEIIQSYKNRNDEESKFIYALDKLEPVLNIYLDKGRSWRKEGVTLDMIKKIKLPKVALNKTIEKIFKEIAEKMTSEHDILFK